jgi:hypothetical protein
MSTLAVDEMMPRVVDPLCVRPVVAGASEQAGAERARGQIVLHVFLITPVRRVVFVQHQLDEPEIFVQDLEQTDLGHSGASENGVTSRGNANIASRIPASTRMRRCRSMRGFMARVAGRRAPYPQPVPNAPRTPAVTILTTVYNREGFIAECVKSVLSQSFPDIAYIVWDDGSTDDSARRAEEAAAGDPRVRVIRAEHRGLASARGSAHKLIETDFFGWVDSDDRLAPRAVERTLGIMRAKPDVGVVYTDHVIIDAQGRELGMGARCAIPYSKERLLVDFMLFHFRLVRRDAFVRAGGIDESFHLAGDYDLCLRLSEIARVEHMREPLYFYRRSDDAVSHTRRLEQIEFSARAIRNALERRGMSATRRLDVEISARYTIRAVNAPGRSQA